MRAALMCIAILVGGATAGAAQTWSSLRTLDEVTGFVGRGTFENTSGPQTWVISPDGTVAGDIGGVWEFVGTWDWVDGKMCIDGDLVGIGPITRDCAKLYRDRSRLLIVYDQQAPVEYRLNRN